MEYVLAFNEAVNLCKLSILKTLIVILQLQDPDAPVLASDMASIVGVKELNKAAETLAAPVPASDMASVVGVKELNKAAETFAGRNDHRVKIS